jgi:hypothetical protein
VIDIARQEDEIIASIIHGLDPVDWVQVELIANLPPERRIIPGMQAQAFARSILRGAFKSRYPGLSRSELNMKVLAHLTTIRS